MTHKSADFEKKAPKLEEPQNQPLGDRLISLLISKSSLASFVIIIVAIFLTLLQHFVLTLPTTPAKLEPVSTQSADGIVVATGGQARVLAGLNLLTADKAKKLLVTGVGQGITKNMIASSLPVSQRQIDLLICCVDLEFKAKDTKGNALATKLWVKQNQIERLILVTSDYHMPRAKLEFETQMPELDIVAYPISAPDLTNKSWYSDWHTLRLYAREFLKYRLRVLTLSF